MSGPVLAAFARSWPAAWPGIGRWNRIALHDLDAVGPQQGRLSLGFDPFGHQVEGHGTRHGDDCCHDVKSFPRPVDVFDEGLVDLEHVDRQAAQIAERRMAGAEIVDRNMQA